MAIVSLSHSKDLHIDDFLCICASRLFLSLLLSRYKQNLFWTNQRNILILIVFNASPSSCHKKKREILKKIRSIFYCSRIQSLLIGENTWSHLRTIKKEPKTKLIVYHVKCSIQKLGIIAVQLLRIYSTKVVLLENNFGSSIFVLCFSNDVGAAFPIFLLTFSSFIDYKNGKKFSNLQDTFFDVFLWRYKIHVVWSSFIWFHLHYSWKYLVPKIYIFGGKIKRLSVALSLTLRWSAYTCKWYGKS